jgi:hypothetical protein
MSGCQEVGTPAGVPAQMELPAMPPRAARERLASEGVGTTSWYRRLCI